MNNLSEIAITLKLIEVQSSLKHTQAVLATLADCYEVSGQIRPSCGCQLASAEIEQALMQLEEKCDVSHVQESEQDIVAKQFRNFFPSNP